MDDLSTNVAFVLFRPLSAGNVGAAARALKNMGFSDLRIVDPRDEINDDAYRMAVHARDVLDAAKTYPDLASAVADCAITAGTTARDGFYRSGVKPVREAAAELIGLAPANRIALIFGPEDFGLTNEELKHCHTLITIPTSSEYRSLNLAQAVMLIAYEVRSAWNADLDTNRITVPLLAPAGEIDAMLTRMTEALLQIGFLPQDNPDHIMFAIRELIGRARLAPRELDILNGIARQINWYAHNGRGTLEAKRLAGEKFR